MLLGVSKLVFFKVK